MNNIQIDIDIAAAQSKFEELMAAIDQTRSKLFGLKKTSEEYKEISKQLTEQEEELVDVINQLGNSADYSKVSYRNLSQTMGEVNKIAKNNTMEVRTKRYTSSLKAMNDELKKADAQIGSYGRNVGNYTNDMVRAQRIIGVQVQQIVRELPSLAQSPEMFLLAISNNIPYLIDSFKNLDNAMSQTSEVGDDVGERMNTTAAAMNAAASANNNNASATIKNTVAMTKNALSAEMLARILKRLGGSASVSFRELYKLGQTLGLTTQDMYDLGYATMESNGRIVLQKKGIDALKESYNKLIAAEQQEQVIQKNVASGGSKLIAALKGIVNWTTVIIIAVTMLIRFWPKLKEMFNSMRKVETSFESGSRSLKQWNEALRAANESAAKSATELIVYSRWATMVSKSDEERSKAADKVVEIMKEHNEVVDVAGVKTGIYKDKIDLVTTAMVKQAQAQAMLNTVTEKYKKVLDAQSEVYETESKGITFGDRVLSAMSKGATTYGESNALNLEASDYYKGRIEKAKKDAEKAKQEFEGWLDKFLKDFNPSDLLNKEDSKSGKDGADKWFSRWELRIKEREALLQKSEKDNLEYSDKEWWKYTQQGIEYHKKMFEEYRTHYAGDEKELSQLLQREREYYAGFALYVQKLKDSYIHPDYRSELNALNEWYTLEYIRLDDIGLLKEKQADLDKEYLKRLFELNRNYRDEFVNAGLYFDDFMSVEERDMQIQLNELDQWFEDQKTIYKQKGIDINNLELEYLRKQAEIKDTWRKAELQKDLAFEQQTANLRMSKNESSFINSTNRIKVNRTGAAVNGGFNGKNDANERAMQIKMLISNYNILEKSIQDQIHMIESTKFESLDAQIEAEQQAAELRMNLADEEARYKMELNRMVKEDAVSKWNEQLEAVSGTFNVFSDLFGNISSLMAEGSEEAKGFAVAAAAMSAIASATEAYKSTVGIPYVGTFLAPIAAASALIAGAANVKQILGTKTDGSNALSSVQGAYVGTTPPQVSQAINAQATTTGLSERVDLNNQSIRAYIVDNDVAEGLNKMNRRNSESSF